MPARDKYHDSVVRALQKEGWEVVADPATIRVGTRFIYVDILARRSENNAIFVEVKVFEGTDSPLHYLAQALGQYLLYRAALDFRSIKTPLHLAVPNSAYVGFLSETFAQHVLRYHKVDLVVYDPGAEVIIQWIP